MGKEDYDYFHAKVDRCLDLGMPGAIMACDLTHTAEKAVSCSTNGKILLWEVDSGRCLGSLDGHKSEVITCSFGNELLATGARDGTVFLWKFKDLKRTSRISVHAGAIQSCCISPNSQFLASASEDNSVKIFLLLEGDGAFVDGPPAKELVGHVDSVNDVAFSLDSTVVATCSSDGDLRVWNAGTGKCMMVLPCNSRISHTRFSANGQYLISLGRNFITVWNLQQKAVHWEIENTSGYQAIAANPITDVFVAVSMDGNLTCFNITTKSEIFNKSAQHRGPVLSCNFSMDGLRLITGGIDGKILVWV